VTAGGGRCAVTGSAANPGVGCSSVDTDGPDAGSVAVPPFLQPIAAGPRPRRPPVAATRRRRAGPVRRLRAGRAG